LSAQFFDGVREKDVRREMVKDRTAARELVDRPQAEGEVTAAALYQRSEMAGMEGLIDHSAARRGMAGALLWNRRASSMLKCRGVFSGVQPARGGREPWLR
jgi:hypothetical protein